MKDIEKLIYRIPKNYHYWDSGCAVPSGWLHGNADLPGARLDMGFVAVQREGVADFPHFHNAVEEYLMFVGSDLVNFFDFDAEIELWLGEDPDRLEKYVIAEPTIVRIPPGLWHCPIRYKRIGRPLAFSAVYMDGDWSKVTRRVSPDGKTDYPFISPGLRRGGKGGQETPTFPSDKAGEKTDCCEQTGSAAEYGAKWAEKLLRAEPAPRSGKYDKYVFTIPKGYHNWGELYANPRGRFNGTGFMPGARLYFGFSVAMKPHPAEIPHIHNGTEEYLWFTGANLEDMFDFDAEIEVSLGWDPDHMETVTVAEPTVIRIPPRLWHCPYVFKRIGKPVNFMAMYLDGDWAKITRKKDEKGDYEYLFEGASLKKCVYNPELTCVYCGRCFKEGTLKDKT
jgi:hypothetical protein